jgi:tRNA A37 threonylcarbamoyladenosine dehydratase
MQNQFARTALLFGAEAMEKLRGSRVAVFGVGGVGGYAVEALGRSGIGTLDLIDNDTVSLTNLNRQIIALHSTLGQNKVDAAAARIRDICPDTEVFPRIMRYEAATREELLGPGYDYIVDAIDLVSCKLDLIQSAMKRSIPIISSMGTGNRLIGGTFQVTDIAKTRDDPLARVMRKELRQRGILHAQVLWAPGEPEKPAETEEEAPAGRRSIPGSVSWVPASAGLKLAEHVILSLAGLQAGPAIIVK